MGAWRRPGAGNHLDRGLPRRRRLERPDHFWPKPIEVVELRDGDVLAGVARRGGTYRVGADVLVRLDDAQRAEIEGTLGFANRTLYQTANYDLYGDDFRWVSEFEVARITEPAEFRYFERQTWESSSAVSRG
jgi:phosphate transport system permease protein